MRTVLSALAVFTLAAVALGDVGERNKGSISSEVTTRPTGFDGRRHSAESGWTTFTVPANCVINRDKTVLHELSAAGSEHHPTVEYLDYVEVAPGTDLKAPRTIRVKTYARGPRGNSSGRGWLRVRVDLEYVQYKK